jgi:glycosyltransferase involved in cell wall biosynthesis
MPLPSISIVTPTLNQDRFIPATLESIFDQAYPAVEYLVMDGGSTDATLAILKKNEHRLRWISRPDNGQSSAINAGWEMTRGEIIAWINSDDVYYPGVFQTVGEYFAAHPDIDIVYGDGDFIDHSGEIIRPYPARAWDYRALVCSAEDFILQPSVFIRRSVLEKAGYLKENLSYVMDFDYWLRAGLCCGFAYLPQKMAGLRLHSSAKSVSQLAFFSKELVQVYQDLFSSTGLPPAVRAWEKQAMGSVFHRASDIAFWAGALPEARQYAWEAFKKNPMRIRRLWLYLLAGKMGYQLANRRYPNPYTYAEKGSPGT